LTAHHAGSPAGLNFPQRERSRMQAACLSRSRGAPDGSAILPAGITPTGSGVAIITIDSGNGRGWLTAK
jgi:hypothetical protein